MVFNNGNFHAPAALRSDAFLLRPILASDAELDYEAVMASKEYLRPWEQSGWPADDFTLDANREDVRKLARWHADRDRYTYTVLNPAETQCLGCVYIIPTSAGLFARQQIAAVDGARWSDYEVAVNFWVRTSRLADGLDRSLLDALGPWLEHAWRIARHLIVTSEQVEQQLSLIESSNRRLKFRITDPRQSSTSLAYAYDTPTA